MIVHILIGFGLVVGYCVLCLVRAGRRCGRCKGTRRSKRYLGLWGPVGKCRKCRGHGRHKRLGATAVHRFMWAVVGERWMERRRQRLDDRRN